MLDRLGRALAHADRVVVVCPPEARLAWTAAVKGLGINVEVLIPEIEPLGVLATRSYDNRLTALVAQGPLDAQEKLLKRAFDLAALIWVLPILLLVTAIVAVAIKLDDGGPVFFVQKRIGQGNRLFSMYKFRSMKVAQLDRDGRVSTARDDDRITRVGGFLRKTSIDELPQLFNVLLGDMSVVGPRPHALASTAGDSLFWDVDHRYWWRHAAKPGLTGLAQVRGFRGSTATADDLTKRVQSDLEYLSGWSLMRDIRIAFATLKVILHPNAF
jgi:lipopolysaccharide/colanic/teichoic acid biosynthesis glycosyltransferase